MKTTAIKGKKSKATAVVSQENHSKLEQFFTTMLQEIYWSEQQLATVLGTMKDAASTKELKAAFTTHQEETREHVTRLDQVFSILGIPADAEPSVGMQGLFDEGWQVIDETEEGSAQRDVALIIGAQKVEHYEIACYGSLVTLARTMGKADIANLLESTLAEEKETDGLLTGIAEDKINFEAAREPAVSEA